MSRASANADLRPLWVQELEWETSPAKLLIDKYMARIFEFILENSISLPVSIKIVPCSTQCVLDNGPMAGDAIKIWLDVAVNGKTMNCIHYEHLLPSYDYSTKNESQFSSKLFFHESDHAVRNLECVELMLSVANNIIERLNDHSFKKNHQPFIKFCENHMKFHEEKTLCERCRPGHRLEKQEYVYEGIYTYIIGADGSDYIKIGKTTDIEKRMAGIQTGHPLPLKLFGCVAGNVEKRLHNAFAHKRSNGEWFAVPADHVIDWLKSHRIKVERNFFK